MPQLTPATGARGRRRGAVLERALYEATLAELPDVFALARVSDDRLHKLWEGLGYYSRAKNLKRAAQEM